MILMTGLDSVIESLYLKEKLTCSSNASNILVNPVSSYIIGKTVIITLGGYPLDYVSELIDNKNKVICRFDIGIDKVIVDPYDLRINECIIPLGKKVNILNEEIYDKVDHIFDCEEGKLYYPKPIKCLDYQVNGKLTSLGYLAYQLGYPINDIIDTKFKNLDVIKLKNGIII